MSQKLKSSTHAFIQKMRVLRYGETTIKAYSKSLEDLFIFCQGTPPAKITYNQVEAFLYKRYLDGVSWSTQNVYINSFNLWQKLAFKQKKRNYDKFRPRKTKTLPKPISKEQIKSGFSQIKNKKHLAICQLLYYCGLRRSEVINVKFTWFNADKTITIFGKGGKERSVPCDIISESLSAYVKEFQPKTYLFNGQKGEKYTASSIYSIVNKYFHCSPHQLRHSFATHLYLAKTDLITIKELLGHEKLETTQIYTKLDLETKKEAVRVLATY